MLRNLIVSGNYLGYFFVFFARSQRRSCTMLMSQQRHDVPKPDKAKNEYLFAIFMVFVAIAVVFGLSIPKSVRAEPLEHRLNRQAPPALVADVLLRRAADGGTGDARWLKAHTDALNDPVSIERDGDLKRVRYDRPVNSNHL